MDNAKNVEGKYLMYKGQPLVREGNTICYGDKSAKHFMILDIMSYKKVDGEDVPDNVLIQIVESANPGNVVKHGEKNGLGAAMDMGLIWLERANKQ